jgi:hypothetical protein
MKIKQLLFMMVAIPFLPVNRLVAQDNASTALSDKLVVILSSDDPHVAESVALMYTHNAKTQKWFRDVTLIVWGPSAKMVSENTEIQEKLKKMQKDGVVLEACIACANMFGVADNLKKLGIDVKGMGKPLTDYLKGGAKVLTF